MSVTFKQYPLDITGVKPSNKVVNEQWDNLQEKTYLIFPLHGHFFSETLTIHTLEGVPLELGDDFITFDMDVDSTLKSGKKVERGIRLLGVDVDSVVINYQALGGEGISNKEVAEKTTAILEKKETVSWSSVIAKPSAYPPEENHLHDARSVYGLEYITSALKNLEYAIIKGSSGWKGTLDYPMGALNQQLEDHERDTTNPHQVTKTQVGLGLVENYPVATQAEAEEGLRNDRYMTPLRVKSIIEINTLPLLVDHLSKFDNPHSVTGEQLGLSELINQNFVTLSDILIGTNLGKYLGPEAFHEIMKAGEVSVSDHERDTTNPHQVTKTQVGLGLVENYPVATQAEAEEGLRNDRLLTPLRVTDVWDSIKKKTWDTRYLTKNKELNASVMVLPNPTRIMIFAEGLWRQVWEAEWS